MMPLTMIEFPDFRATLERIILHTIIVVGLYCIPSQTKGAIGGKPERKKSLLEYP